MHQKVANNQHGCNVLNFNQLGPNYFSLNSKVFYNEEYVIYLSHSTTKSFPSILFMSNRNYSYIFSPDILWGNISIQSETALCKLIHYSDKLCVT